MDQDPQYRTPDGSALRIWRDSAKNNFLSEREGRPVFDEVTYVEVISPGSRGSTPVFEVKRVFDVLMDHPLPMYSMQYEQFKQYVLEFEKQEEDDKSLTGTPLKEWSEISRTMAASLKASNVFSVEALAALSDEKLSVIGPDGRTWRTKAQAYLDNAKSSAHSTALAAELERIRDELAAKDTAMKALSDLVTDLQVQLATTAKKPASTGKADKTAEAVAAPAADITVANAAPAPVGDDVVAAPGKLGDII